VTETAMDINVLRSVSTVLAFVCFVGIVWWAYRRRTQKEFAVAEQLPFADNVDERQPLR